MGVLRALSLLPVRWQLSLGKGFGRVFGYLAPRRKRIANINLKLCFPKLSDQQRQQLLHTHLTSLGVGLFEFALAWWGSDSRIRKLGQVQGLEHLQQAQASGRGILLLTGHFTALEMGARFITLHHDFHAMYRPHANPLYQNMMRNLRELRSGRSAVVQNDVRGALRVLKRGGTLWYAPDQDYGRDSIFVPFFDIPARTITATARLAKATNALVLPYYPQRLPNGQYQITILPALDNFPTDDVEADTARISRLIEHWVRQTPEQYLWVHRRFKKRPPGEAKFY